MYLIDPSESAKFWKQYTRREGKEGIQTNTNSKTADFSGVALTTFKSLRFLWTNARIYAKSAKPSSQRGKSSEGLPNLPSLPFSEL